MAFLEKFLFLKKSCLPNAGLGLFTKTNIKKGTRIVEYKGKVVPWKNVKNTDGYNGYLFKINNRIAIDAKNYKKAFARYANDARGLSKITGIKNNCEYDVADYKCYMFAIKNISKGEEILIAYGAAYWQLMRKIAKTKIK